MKAYVIEKYEKQRGNPPTILELAILLYVIGFILEETQEILLEGINSYLRNLWNFIDFTRNVLYTAVFLLRVVSYFQQASEIQNDPTIAYIRREDWYAFDPQLIAEGLFAAANIFSALKLVHLFSINPHLGPLQISLGRMVIDIVKFFFIYSLVLFAFACGLNQLLWYFSNLEKQKCYHLSNGEPDFDGAADSCMKWRRFANVFESSQSLFWASFGMVDLVSFELSGIKTYTRFWGLLMFGSYSVINVIVLLNLLIAMMSNSYAMIVEHSDTEWKFARTKLWMSYFEETGTLPPPFNIFPKPKLLLKLCGMRKKDKLRRMSTKRRNREEKERDYRYTAVMRSLVWRYVSAMHRKCDEELVTEDDVNELKSDISSFRYEILEVLGKNGMDISFAKRKDTAILGKKMKIWERRLMKDFKVAPVSQDEDQDLFAPPPENENSLARFRRIAKLAVLDSNTIKWRQVVKNAQIASQIGRCHRKDSVRKQQNLQRAMDAARQLAYSKSPENVSRATTPIMLPDLTGSEIANVLTDGNSKSIFALSPNITIKTGAEKPKKQTAPSTQNLTKDSSLISFKQDATDSIALISPKHEQDLIQLDTGKCFSLPSILKSEKSLDSLDHIQNERIDYNYLLTSPPIIVSSPLDEKITSYEKIDSIDLNLNKNKKSEMDDILGKDWNTPDVEYLTEEVVSRPRSPIPILLDKQDEHSETQSPELQKQLSQKLSSKITSPEHEKKLTIELNQIRKSPEPSQQLNEILSDASPKKFIPEKTDESKSINETIVLSNIVQNPRLEQLQEFGSPKIDIQKSQGGVSEQINKTDFVVSVSLDAKIPLETEEPISTICTGDGPKLESSSKNSSETCKPVLASKSTVTFSDMQQVPVPQPKTPATTPLAQRNIQRIHDKISQPKYGWL